MIAVHSVLPESTLSHGAMHAKFVLSAEPDYAPATYGTLPGVIPYQEPNPVPRTRRIAYAYADERMRRMAYGLGAVYSAPEWGMMADEMARHFQGHHLPSAYVGGRSGRYDYGMAGHNWSNTQTVLPDSYIPHRVVDKMFDQNKVYHPGIRNLANRFNMGEHFYYGLAGDRGDRPSYIDFMLRRRSQYGNRGMAALSCDDAGICYNDTGDVIGTVDGNTGLFQPASDYTGPSPNTTPVATSPSFSCPGPGCPGGTPTATLPNGTRISATDTNTLILKLSQMGYNLASLQTIQPGTYQSPNGVTIRQNPGLPVPVPLTSTNVGIGANVSTGAAIAGSTVALIGLGLVALMVLGKRG